MSRQPKLRPKSHIPGLPEGLYDLSAMTPISELESRQGFAEDKREQRVFRVKRKHVLKACDRCRVKKTKCDGKQPCNRCSAYNHPCLFRERKATQTKVYSRGFVEMLESHHSLVVKALQKLYKHCVNKEGFPGEPLAEAADGYPLTHAILDRLGLIKQAEENSDEPDEDSEDLQYLRILSTSTDCSATTDPSPEPTTPPDPYPSNCASVTASPRGGESWKWDYQSVQPDQYHSYSGAGYHGMVVSQPPLGPTGLAEVPCSEAAPPPTPNHPPYLYYPNNGPYGESAKHRLHSGIMNTSGSHSHTTGLPAGMLNEYQHFQQPLYPGVNPNWHFPSG